MKYYQKPGVRSLTLPFSLIQCQGSQANLSCVVETCDEALTAPGLTCEDNFVCGRFVQDGVSCEITGSLPRCEFHTEGGASLCPNPIITPSIECDGNCVWVMTCEVAAGACDEPFQILCEEPT
jgi:hypothetical protein